MSSGNNNPKQIIVKFQGDSYDITDFLKKHPGGVDILVENNGKDIEQVMKDIGHTADAYDMLKQYKIR